LLWALSLNFLLVTMILSNFPLLHTAIWAPSRAFAQAQALSLAEIGIDEGLWYLNGRLSPLVQQYALQNAPWITPGQERADLNGNNAITIGDILAASADPWFDWTCDVKPNPTSCTRTFLGYPPEAVANEDLGDVVVEVAEIDSLQPVITATGSFPSQTNALAKRTIRVVAERRFPTFWYAALAENVIVGDSSTTRSYDSSTGVLGAEGHVGAYGGPPPLDAGGAGPFATIDGEVHVGAGYTFSVDPTATITGGAPRTIQQSTLPPVVFPDPAELSACWGSSHDLGAFSGSTTLLADTLYCATSVSPGFPGISMEPGARLYIEPMLPGTALTINGPNGITARATTMNRPNQVFINGGSAHVDSNLHGLYNMNSKPGAFQFYLSGGSFYLRQYEAFHGTVYAPQGQIRAVKWYNAFNVGSLAVYGSLVGKTVMLGGFSSMDQAPVFFDTQLRTLRLDGGGPLDPTTPRFRIKSWHVQTP